MFKKLGVRQKILFLIAVPLIVIIGVTSLTIFQLNSVAGNMKQVLYDEGLAATSMVLNADRDMYQSLTALQEMAALDSTNRTVAELETEMLENFEQVFQRVDEAEAVLNNNRAVWEKYTHETSGKNVFQNFEIIRTDFGAWSDLAATMARNNRVSVIYATTFLEDFNSARAGMNEVSEILEQAMVAEVAEVEEMVLASAIVVIAVVVVSFVLVVILSLIVTGGIIKIMRKASQMLDELSLGHLSTRVEVRPGARDEISQMINKMNQFADYLQQGVIGNMQKIAAGELSVELDISDETDEISPALMRTVESLRTLINEADKLTAAAVAGELKTRGDASMLEGAYADIINGFNATLDGVVEPVEEAKVVLGKLSTNDLTVPMSDQYSGMMAELAGDINQVRDNLLDLQDAIVKASQGDIRRLEEFRKRGRLSENDQLTPSVHAVYKSIQEIIRAAYELTKAATGGDLSKRADVEKFNGGYRRIVDGFNKTIDALVEPIQGAAIVIQALSHGDLTVSMDGDYQGDNAMLKDALNGAIDSFNRLLDSIRQASDEVATGSRELSNSSQTLSQGATEQASSIEEVTASIEELANQTKLNANNAGAASQLSNEARVSADKGNERMKRMLNAMTEINDSSNNISKIIKVIDDIAFQTNILALNAAVEAARAGQHGKGFAVVAEEVRNLAARSAEAARETTAMIEKSIEHVNDGTGIAERTAAALKDIVEKVSQTNDLVLQIAEASNEQASGIAQINTGLVQVSRVVQMNSATSEESAAASEELSSQAEMLKQYVAQFKLKDVSAASSTKKIDESVDNKQAKERTPVATSTNSKISKTDSGKQVVKKLSEERAEQKAEAKFEKSEPKKAEQKRPDNKSEQKYANTKVKEGTESKKSTDAAEHKPVSGKTNYQKDFLSDTHFGDF
jgi:methyl-accepting chemotaxis protein